MNTKDDNPIKDDIKNRSSKLDYSELKKRYDLSLKTIEELEQQKADILQIKNQVSTFEIKGEKGLKSEATAFIIASDWHVGKRVVSSKVNGLNSFNLKVFDKRAKNFFINSVTLLRMFERDITIKTVILGLLGDFIENVIHDGMAENNTLLPIDETIIVQDYIASGIKYLLKNTSKEIIIPCLVGNHSRTTKKIHTSTEVENSLEYFMYSNLKNIFSDEKRVKFIIADGSMLYLKVYGYQTRFLHGTSIKFGGGIGGLYIPAGKAISQWNKAKHADLTVFGHFHQSKFSGWGGFICNGSLCGYDDYALSIKCDWERPQQQFFLIDKNRGFTINAPILLDEN
jgi:predicted phosphodiesterase